MINRIVLAFSALALLVPVSAAAQTPTAPAAATAEAKADIVHVRLDTAKGPILLALDRGRAPLTVANFLRYVDARRYDGISFYRAMPYGEGNGLIQAGITKDARLLFPPIAHEPSSKTGIKHEPGTILLANAGPGTGRSEFFITLGAIPFGEDFAPFGKVVEGMEVVKAIFASPVDPDKGAGPMKGQMLSPQVLIRTTRTVTP
ncbi:peptidyl-prolyl cis-trans isomerase A (cyclophilin A) [Sphingomonas kaistensis]|uniref:Peptidyl-prolyl cis-trans isomerase n=1 Tax=Sphingomonas kaistensis TaxID=298708 RepID=A0A7X6BG56_9SPHN|nr:peptidylprolyl isomerase [Sphingomonas kaistensis]NJC04672.1 peptidyl-prolyl cis-trans isomerase A (cyclophilin A) [Sphingomonas kaistensis]